MGRHLVVGADSFVGAALIKALRQRGHETLGTTRRKDTIDGNRLYLDLEDPRLELPVGLSHAYLVAAVTHFAPCENNSVAAEVNSHAPAVLADKLLAAGAHVIFTSSGGIFSGKTAWPDEKAQPDPPAAYARQKAAAEKALEKTAQKHGARELLSIVRLSKVLHWQTPPFPDWRKKWKNNEVARPFSDLIFAPITLEYAAICLARIGEDKIAGLTHVSGNKNINYAEFAKRLALRLGIEPRLVDPVSSDMAGVNLYSRPKFSGLGMRDTFARAGIKPQPLEDVLEYMASSY